jgi:hypothetical protein
MAGIRGRSGPPGNQNAFRYGLAGIAQRRADGVLYPQEQLIREEILSGLLTTTASESHSVYEIKSVQSWHAAWLLDYRIRSRQHILWNRQADPPSGF